MQTDASSESEKLIKDVAEHWRNLAMQKLGERKFVTSLMSFNLEMQELEEVNRSIVGNSLAFEIDFAFEEILILLADDEADSTRKLIALWWLVAHRPEVAIKTWVWLERKINKG